MTSNLVTEKFYPPASFKLKNTNMKNYFKIYILTVILILPVLAFSQRIAKNRADKYYNNLQYSKAIKIYETLHEDDPNDIHIIKRLAYANYKISEYQNALDYFAVLSESDESLPEDWYKYAQLLKVERDYANAGIWLEKYLSKIPGDKLAKDQLEKIEQIKTNDNPMVFIVRRTNRNTRFTDMCPVFYKKKLVFSSSRDSFSVVENKNYWNGQPFLDLFIAGYHKRSLFEVEKFAKELNSRYHEGPIVFSKDENTIFFTRNSNKKGESQKGLNNLKIFISHWDGNRWSKEMEFPYNSDEYSVGHPALSNDEQTLYFVSNMPGGFGKSDLYKSERTTNGWSQPMNLGSSINTLEKEMFPTIDAKGNLFFSSNGHPGYGGLDIFVAPILSSGELNLVNLGNTLNSSFDDFSVVFNDSGEEGFFTSNRLGGIGGDDIYHFELEGMKMEIIVRDSTTKLPLDRTFVELYINGNIPAKKMTDENGKVSFNVKIEQSYRLRAMKKDYRTASTQIKTIFSENPFKLELNLLKRD